MMGALRVNRNVLRQQEATAVNFFVERLPAWCTPDQLTALSAAGAMLAGIALICCWISGWFVLPAILGLFLNWYGDSLDGALARLRKIERPRIGYLLDRGADVASFTAMILGLGLSPYFTVFSALMLLLVYYAHTIYILLRNVIDRIHVIGLVGIGATEGRMLIGAWAAFAELVGRDIVATRVGGVLLIDLAYGALFAAALAMFIVRLMTRRASGAVGIVVPLARGESPRPRPARALSQEPVADRAAFHPGSGQQASSSRRQAPFPTP
jgi:phosphatidylglycerophosphate synthase